MEPCAYSYERTFKGMTTDPVELDDLLAARERVMSELQGSLDEQERRFLHTLIVNQPDLSLLAVPHARELPGIRWKLHKLRQL